MKWEGRILNDEEATKIKGKITIPNLSEENDLDEIEINITTEEYNDKSDLVKKFMNSVGRSKIRELLGKYMHGLRNDYAKNLILPRKDDIQVGDWIIENLEIISDYYFLLVGIAGSIETHSDCEFKQKLRQYFWQQQGCREQAIRCQNRLQNHISGGKVSMQSTRTLWLSH